MDMNGPESTPPPRHINPAMRTSLRGFLLRVWLRLGRALFRRLSSSLTRRIATLNLVGLVALFLGFLFLNQTRLGVIDARSQSLSLQAEMISAALYGAISGEPDTSLLDPENLLQLPLNDGQLGDDLALPFLEFSINPARIAPILRRLVVPTRTRARVYDGDGLLLLDTKAFYSPGAVFDSPPAVPQDATTLFERSWNAVRQSLGRVDITPGEDAPGPRQYVEVQRALLGLSGSTVRVAADGQTIVFAASPIGRARNIRGVLLLSTEAGDVDHIIAEERWGFFLVFLTASAVMLVLSVLLAGTIAEPVRRLSEAADRVRRGTRVRHEIPDFSDRTDEIGQLSVSLREMTGALYSRIEAIERFAADVAHELKNPLTSLRSAVETLPLARKPESQARLLEVIVHDVQRLDRLITDISDASRLDAELQRIDAQPLDLVALLETIIGMRNDVRPEGVAPVRLIKEGGNPGQSLRVKAHDSRIVQVFDNLIDNAQSFSPPEGEVRISLRRGAKNADIIVEDDGPGIPDHALERVFERFYTDRPDHGFGQNSGLGLSISRQIIAAHHGLIRAENRISLAGERLGARFIVTLPLADA
jgi:two-component system, OmpR family, sensor histidine kinase ChvG